MTPSPRRGVTRGYVGGVLFAAEVMAVALVIAVWGLLTMWRGDAPIGTAVPLWAAPVILVGALVALGWALWRQALALLRGQWAPAWALVCSVAVGAYLLWCLGGVAIGLTIAETWASPYAIALAPIWAATALVFWAVLARRIYTDRPPPRWPWERDSRPEGED